MNARLQARRLNKKIVRQHALDVVDLLGINEGETIIDIGSGGGIFTFAFSKLVGEDGCVFAADINNDLLKLIENTQNDFNNIQIINIKNNKNLLKHKYDLIFIRNVFHHLDEPISFFTALQPCLSKKGRIVIIDYNEKVNLFLKTTGHYTCEKVIFDVMKKSGFSHSKSYKHLKEQSFNIFEI